MFDGELRGWENTQPWRAHATCSDCTQVGARSSPSALRSAMSRSVTPVHDAARVTPGTDQ